MHNKINPGDIIAIDARSGVESPMPDRLKIIQWNIERGYKLPEILKILKKLDADIVGLQELDINCGRSGNVDTVAIIAEKLGMNAAFVCEFEELDDSRLRRAKDAGGGYHGNAILTRWDLANVRAIPHDFQSFDWEVKGSELGEPRRGRRYSISAEVCDSKQDEKRVLVYSSHLEVFCGPIVRLFQFSELFQDCWTNLKFCPRQIILGDLNTMRTGIARFSPKFCSDCLRWQNLGYSEARLFDELVLRSESKQNRNAKLEKFFEKHVLKHPQGVSDLENLRHTDGETIQDMLNQLYKNLINPGFKDPFNLEHPTLQAYGGLFGAKLDWLLYMGLHLVAESEIVGVEGMNASDHCFLYAELSYKPDKKNKSHYPSSNQRYWGSLLVWLALSFLIVFFVAVMLQQYGAFHTEL